MTRSATYGAEGYILSLSMIITTNITELTTCLDHNGVGCKDMDNMNSTVAVVGAGIFGTCVALELLELENHAPAAAAATPAYPAPACRVTGVSALPSL